MKYVKDWNLIEKNIKGYYRTGAFHIFLEGNFSDDLSSMSKSEQGTFLHEYIHYLQNISTPWGIFVGATHNSEIIETLESIIPVKSLVIPYTFNRSSLLQDRLTWINVMNGDNCHIYNGLEIDQSYPLEYGIITKIIGKKNGNLVYLKARLNNGKIIYLSFGASIIKESMAALYQSLIDSETKHPDLPYNTVQILCNQFFPEIAKDTKKIITLCYTCLFDMQPGFKLIELLKKASSAPQKSGFDIFDDYVNNTIILSGDEQLSVVEHFETIIDLYKESLMGLLRSNLQYLDDALNRVKLTTYNAPILNVLNDVNPFSIDHLKALVGFLGIPFIHSANGWHFPKDSKNIASSDVIYIYGMSLLYEFLVSPRHPRVCPFAGICGSQRNKCYDEPWLEDEKCAFGYLSNELGLNHKKLIWKI